VSGSRRIDSGTPNTLKDRRAALAPRAVGGPRSRPLAVALIATWPAAAHLGTRVVDPGGAGAAGLWSQMYLPLALATGDPVLAHQATLVLTFAAAFLAMAALVRDWTGSWPAAVAAGTPFATCGLRMGQLAALHLEGSWYLPLVVLFARRTALGAGLAAPGLLAAVLVLVTLHSCYLGYAAFGAAGVVALTAIAAEPRARRRWAALTAAIGAAAACVAAVSLPYVAAARAGALAPPRTAYAGIAFPVRLRVENGSTTTWPALAAAARGLVQLAGRWEDDAGAVVGAPWYDRLPFDLAPGDAVEAELAVAPPPTPAASASSSASPRTALAPGDARDAGLDRRRPAGGAVGSRRAYPLRPLGHGEGADTVGGWASSRHRGTRSSDTSPR
jgi:hypothetical protein